MRWRVNLSSLLLLCSISKAEQMNSMTNIRQIASFSGNYLLPIKHAYHEFSKTGLNANDYMINILESDSEVIISFEYKNLPKGFRGSIQGTPNFQVEIDKVSGQVLRSSYGR
jgi:hypothetical protein